ncbi:MULTISPECIES: acetyltransferase [unclassified Bradyrhizobium]|uniref:acetyltransferase n=1 Tax=unclassified Bradyrhizobium TaxID=2631580 RepID=UPI001BAC7611|nr:MULTISPECIES: acetyltransferase [unclassified Bradyrhizobium]MBR1206630.1 acetyltransferase [Bradyrhizobium sp. AUGA SZCCT0124]MBR1315392.1 acetyltransferase [Bradyrhizobium sp. AUGA SZCCT0051]MBR1338546.1 acetyltransferase [Bradyrhizobium sp. AUGA SZCCT0105]MBR1356201.1 acetyltransferase [Bradyrhizobium sp. AUGA SZCCT0045]
MNWNFNYLAKVALGRPTCQLASGARIGSKARILNPRDSSRYIRVGRNTFVNGELCALPHGGDIDIGERCYIDVGVRIWSGISIKIEDDVVIGPNVNIFDNISHPLSATKRKEQAISIFTVGHPRDMKGLLLDKPIIIGRGTTIGTGAFVLRGAVVAPDSIVPPGTIVTKYFP